MVGTAFHRRPRRRSAVERRPYRNVGVLRAVAQWQDVRSETPPKPLLYAQIETAEALANVDAIAAVAGVDVLFVGPADLAFDLKARQSPLAFDDCLARVAAAAKATGKAAGILTRDDAQIADRLAFGYTHQAVDSDLGILRRRYAELTGIST